MEYAFITKEGLAEMCRNISESENLGATPILVGCDHRSKATRAMAVNTKGPSDSAVKWLTGKIDQAGCQGVKVVIKSDHEESIIAPKKAVAIKRQTPTVSIESPV